MTSLDNHASSKLDKINYLRRKRERNERREKQKEADHWNFIAGSLVAKYLKADLNIPVYKGKDATAKNDAAFAPLENILSHMAAHKEFTDQIAKGVRDPPVSSDP